MFAVPGWSVSADSLQAEKVNSGQSSAPSKTRKRKRANGAPPTENVTSSNVADLYGSVIEGKKSDAPKADAKRQKKVKEAKEAKKESGAEVKTTTGEAKPKKNKKNKDTQQQKKKRHGEEGEAEEETESNTASKESSKEKAVAKAPPPLPPAPPKLTPLQASMREKLISARFRHLNETLYTRPSEEAYRLFQDSPEMFDEYHEGFRRQVKVWPENPVDSFLADIRGRGKIKFPAKGRPGISAAPIAKTPLPRTQGTCTIADLGCGDARLAEQLQADGKKMRVEVNSYDLQSPSPLVTKADIANLPLEDGSVNVAVFCLALMGTNWVDFIEEAYRILHWKGELWVAEIKSRFGPVRSKNAPVLHSVGNRKKLAAKKAKAAGADDGAHDEDLAVEVDGMEDRRRETDVSAFVEVLKSRGFVLQGERNESIDLSNKMFVKMHFIKGATPTKGKGVKPQEAPRGGKKGIIRKIDAIDEQPEINEASILKPCVYKIR